MMAASGAGSAAADYKGKGKGKGKGQSNRNSQQQQRSPQKRKRKQRYHRDDDDDEESEEDEDDDDDDDDEDFISDDSAGSPEKSGKKRKKAVQQPVMKSLSGRVIKRPKFQDEEDEESDEPHVNKPCSSKSLNNKQASAAATPVPVSRPPTRTLDLSDTNQLKEFLNVPQPAASGAGVASTSKAAAAAASAVPSASAGPYARSASLPAAPAAT